MRVSIDRLVIGFVFGFLFCTGAASTATAAQAAMLSVADVVRDVELARASLVHLHPGYTRYTSRAELDAAWGAIVRDARDNDGMSAARLYSRVQRVLAEIRCNHTKAELPPALKGWLDETAVFFPFRWQFVGGRAVITRPADGLGLKPGDEILAIDGAPVENVAARWRPYVSVDGYNEHARDEELSYSTELAGGVIELFSALEKLPADTVQLRVGRASGETDVVVVPRLTGKEWQDFVSAGGSRYRNFKDALDLKFVAPGVAYLSVATFVNYREPVQPAELYDPLFQRLRDRDAAALILDLRGNGGGSDDAMLGLFQRLIDRPRRVFREVIAAANNPGPAAGHISTWDPRAMAMNAEDFVQLPTGEYRVDPGWVGASLEEQAPHPLAFAGKLIVLTDASLSSGTNHLVSAMIGRNQLTLVGEMGGGSAAGVTAGVIYFLTLPSSGIVVRVPAWRQFIDRDIREDGYGVQPDIVAARSLRDWRAARDPALAAALLAAKAP